MTPILDIRQGVICTSDGRYVKLLEILPVNFYLKSVLEQQAIVQGFASFLKIAPDNLQFIIRTHKADIDEYCGRMEEFYEQEENENCRSMILENAQLVNYLAENEALTRRFYMAFAYTGRATSFDMVASELREQADSAAAFLRGCGLDVMTHENEDLFLFKTVYSFYNKTEDWNVEDMDALLTPVHGAGTECIDGDVDPDGMSGFADLLAPTVFDTTHRDYVDVDGVLHSYWYVTGYGYPTQTGYAWLSSLVELGEGISVSFTLERKRKDAIVPKMAKTAMINKSRMREVGDTRGDFEELEDAIDSALYMKNEINRNGEEFYYMHTLIEITALDEETLDRRIGHVKNVCASLDLVVRPAVYKHEQCFLSMLPLVKMDEDIRRKARRNILTTAAAAAFPFSSFELCDDHGILLGVNLHNNSAVILSNFDRDKYVNGNIALFGGSGAGKTYTMILIAQRLRMIGVKNILIVPEKGFEYRYSCEAMGGQFVRIGPDSADRINPLEIRRKTMDIDHEILDDDTRDDSVLLDKIQKLHVFYSLICPELSQEEHNLLDVELLKVYEQFGIFRDNGSLTLPDGRLKPMPDLAHLYPLLEQNGRLSTLASATRRLVSGSAAGFGGQSTIQFDNKHTVIDLSSLSKEYTAAGMHIAAEYSRDVISQSRIEKCALFMDEGWKIADSKNQEASDFITELVKLIRGYNGIFVSGTQNLSDYFKSGNGEFGKSLLGNSRIKILLQMEEAEALEMKTYMNLSDEETLQIVRSGRGQGLLCAGRNRISIAIRSSETEYELITTTADDLEKRKKA